MSATVRCLLASCILFASAAVGQQSISLHDAVQMALERNPSHKVALAETKIAKAGVVEVRAGLLPRIGFSEIATRSNDPVYVFGTKLRQQSFTADDFSLDRLNRPTPIGNFSSRFTGEWRLFDSMQTFKSLERARRMQEAVERQLERADQELVARVVQSYCGAQLARRKVALAEGSLKTAQSIESDSRARVESGMTVEADLLSAQVISAQRKQELVRAQNDLAYAIAQLAVEVGLTPDSRLELQEALTARELPKEDIAELETAALQKRPDLQRIRSEQSAQKNSVDIAKSAFGPKLGAFASWETDSHSLGWNGGNNWTAGLELQVDLFSGGAKQAQLHREKARMEQIEAVRRGAEDRIKLEVRRAYYDHDSARQQLTVSKTATDQAAESLRILSNRYESGLASVTDLLRAEEAVHKTQVDYWEAVTQTQISYVQLELATGRLNIDSPVVTQ